MHDPWLSQQALAELAGLSRGWLLSIENNRRSPRLEDLEKLGQALGVPIAAFLTDSPQPPPSAVSSRPQPVEPISTSDRLDFIGSSGRNEETDMDRRGFIKAGAGLALGALTYADRLALAADRRLVEDLRRANSNLGRDSWTMSPRVLLPMVRNQLAYTMAMAEGTPGSVSRELLSISGELASLAGRLACFCDNHGDALHYLRLALRLAGEAQDEVLRAGALTQQRNLYTSTLSGGLGGRPDHALATLDEADRAAGPHASPITRTWIHVLRADELAVQGHERECYRDLEEADRAFALVREPNGFFEHWNLDRQARFRGGCEVLLGHWKEGIAILEDVRSRMSRDLIGPYVTTTADIAAAYAQQGEAEKACELLNEALDLAAPAGLITGGISHVVGIRQQFLNSDIPPVGVLDERLRTWAL